MLCSLQIACKASKSAIEPHICTGIIALVFGVIAFLTAIGSNVRELSMSTNTGIAPTETTASKLATKVNAGMMISSP